MIQNHGIHTLRVLERNLSVKVGGLEGGPIDGRLVNILDNNRTFLVFSSKCEFMAICTSLVEVFKNENSSQTLYVENRGMQLNAPEARFR